LYSSFRVRLWPTNCFSMFSSKGLPLTVFVVYVSCSLECFSNIHYLPLYQYVAMRGRLQHIIWSPKIISIYLFFWRGREWDSRALEAIRLVRLLHRQSREKNTTLSLFSSWKQDITLYRKQTERVSLEDTNKRKQTLSFMEQTRKLNKSRTVDRSQNVSVKENNQIRV
jgi:hypothetical protein